MRIYIYAKTNSEKHWLNEMHIRTSDGRKIVIDRDSDYDFWYDEYDKAGCLVWRGIYQWDGENEIRDLSIDLFKGAVIEEIVIEDDAPEDYYFKPLRCYISGFSEDSEDEIVCLKVEK